MHASDELAGRAHSRDEYPALHVSQHSETDYNDHVNRTINRAQASRQLPAAKQLAMAHEEALWSNR